MKRLAPYLCLELSKHQARADVLGTRGDGTSLAWAAGLEIVQASDALAEWLGRGGGLYDHGVLGWSEDFPEQRVADLLDGQMGALGCAQIMVLSSHLAEVAAVERDVWHTLVSREGYRSLPVSASSAQIEPEQALIAVQPAAIVAPTAQKGVRSRRRVGCLVRRSSAGEGALSGAGAPLPASERQDPRHIPAASRPARWRGEDDVSPTLEGRRTARRSDAHRRETQDNEMEYVLKLAQYYESLTPAQRRDLDREMQIRSPSEFRAWLRPILDRTH